MTGAAHSPRAVDVVVAAGCWVILCGVLLATPVLVRSDDASVVVAAPGAFGWWATLFTITVQSFALVWIRSSTRRALVAVAAVPLLLTVAGAADTFSLTSVPVAAAVLLAGLRRPWLQLRPSFALAATILVVGVFANALMNGRPSVAAALGAATLQAVGVIGGPLLVAGAISGHRDALEAGRRELQAVAREHDALVQAAVAQERTEMARELHDIAAHHLSGIALMTAAIERQIDAHPETAKRSVRQVRLQSTAVLDDLRRLVGLMREDADAPRSVTSLATVRELVDQHRGSGASVELRTLPAANSRPVAEGLGTLAQLAIYRITQESLTNAARHAPGAPVVVEIDDRVDDALVLTITNAPAQLKPSSASGFGLLGMQERADLLGATLRYGSQPQGGWQVRVEVPRDLSGRGTSTQRGREEAGR